MIPQGRLGKITIAGTVYPVYDWQITDPRNIQQGMPVGNTWATAKGEGLQSSRFTARIMCREAAAEMLHADFWALWHTRTWGTNFDQTSASTIIANSGANTYTLANAKADSYQIVVQKGAIVGLSISFLAPGHPTKAALSSVTSYLNTRDTTGLLMFDKAIFGGFSGDVYSATISYSNNHVPDAPLDGTKLVSSWDAGPMTADATFTVKEWSGTSIPIADDSELTMALNAVRTFTIKAATPENSRDISVTPGQTFQTLRCVCTGTASVAPLAVS
jgi:hypothetical protein